MRKIFTPLIAAALALAAAAAAAAQPAERISTRVEVADLNLQTDAGAEAALRRIQNAARQICGDQTGVRDLQRQEMADRCVRDAVNTTVASSHSPVLAAVNGTPLSETTTVAAAN